MERMTVTILRESLTQLVGGGIIITKILKNCPTIQQNKAVVL